MSLKRTSPCFIHSGKVHGRCTYCVEVHELDLTCQWVLCAVGVCRDYSDEIYPKFKAWCDDYFYLPARAEHRGIGGLFFDDLDPKECSFDVEGFVKTVGSSFLDSWAEIAQKRRGLEFGQNERDWQLLRRGRYLEFNLLYDRGVKFGLKGGRMESIMVSAPPLISWKYMANPESGSPEEQLVEILKAPKDWASM